MLNFAVKLATSLIIYTINTDAACPYMFHYLEMDMKILTAAQMGEVDKLTTERFLIPSILLMENAGRSFADELAKAVPGLDSKRILIFCGRGNNGGDGLVVARYLALRGAKPCILLFCNPDNLKGDARTNWEIVQAMNLLVRILSTSASTKAYLRKADAPDVIVDALFGTGLSKPIGADFRPIVEWINKASCTAFIASVDIPSGLRADSFQIPGPAVRAQLTVTFSALKLAHVMPPAADCAGKIVLADIGSPPVLFENPEYRVNLIDPEQVRKCLPRRARDSHKGTFGHVYVVAGSRGKSGAALMSGFAALRAGSGLVTIWLPASLQRTVVGRFPELMTEFLPETDEGTSDCVGAEKILSMLSQSDALVLGPGMTTHSSTKSLIWELVRRSPVPVILDADGINAFAPPAELIRNEQGQPVIITPHPGEMARLTGRKISEVQKNRIQTAIDYALQHQCYVVLKGSQTLAATPAGDLFINNTGNPGMATGGTGDILAGMMGRFIAGWKRQIDSGNTGNLADYISAAVYFHGLAGDLAAEDTGMESLVAMDILTYLPKAFKNILSS
jgi:ADP-dependent NAD(P)H-hydrate dehydratase / NAD(P)H-hydrate epimerase